MKAVVSGIVWAVVILAVALASRAGFIVRDSAAALILGLAVISAIQIGVIGPRGRGCAACRGEPR